MFDTWFTVVLLGILVQMDILLAARGFPKATATRYDVAAVPAKGIYLVLVAVSVLIFPYVRSRARPQVVVTAAAITMGLGLAMTVILVVSRGLVAGVLGQDVASVYMLVVLGCAMSVAGATGVIVNCGVALGVARPWPPLLLGLLALLASWIAWPTTTAFAAAVLGVQACTLLISLWVCLKGRRGAAFDATAAPLPVMLSRPSLNSPSSSAAPPFPGLR